MRTTRISNAVLLAAAIAFSGAGAAFAQENGDAAHHPANSSQAAPQSRMGDMMGQGQGAMPGGPGMMQRGMMGQGQYTMAGGSGMMSGGMMGGTMRGGMPMMGMSGPMLKIMFAIADTDGDGSLSFDEVTAIHKRIFDAMDANKDGKVTPEEMQAFWRQ